jgi:hypothetical protein
MKYIFANFASDYNMPQFDDDEVEQKIKKIFYSAVDRVAPGVFDDLTIQYPGEYDLGDFDGVDFELLDNSTYLNIDFSCSISSAKVDIAEFIKDVDFMITPDFSNEIGNGEIVLDLAVYADYTERRGCSCDIELKDIKMYDPDGFEINSLFYGNSSYNIEDAIDDEALFEYIGGIVDKIMEMTVKAVNRQGLRTSWGE